MKELLKEFKQAMTKLQEVPEELDDRGPRVDNPGESDERDSDILDPVENNPDDWIKEMVYDILAEADYDLYKSYLADASEEPEFVEDRLGVLVDIAKNHIDETYALSDFESEEDIAAKHMGDPADRDTLNKEKL